ncbi:MAG: DUF47 family protein [Ruminococcaceae bacterium]|nr:DUF47 family protein [Oscillospiraceae bacterium]
MAKRANDYFELLSKQVKFCTQAADKLEAILNTYSLETISDQQRIMHEIEQNADNLHHEILAKLSREFITPIDQEDILRLVQIVDDVTDALDEVVIDLYTYNVKHLSDDILALVGIVKECVTALDSAVSNLKNFKNPDVLRPLLVEVNNIESKADVLYIEAIHRLFISDINVKEIIGIKEIFDSLENCCDLCEHAADVIEQTVIKNV